MTAPAAQGGPPVLFPPVGLADLILDVRAE